MKKIITIIGLFFGLGCVSSCSDWLDIQPKDKLVTEDFWNSKEEVEAVLGSGYRILRAATPFMIDWGELRGGSIYAYSNAEKQRLQRFQLTSNDKLCRWAVFYEVINMANSVIRYAPQVQQVDETYRDSYRMSHQTEAYFLRALCHFYLVRNFKEVPLVIEPYVDDSAPFTIAKSSEAELIAQIKTDIRTALETGAAKEFFEDSDWEGTSKGRATKWALYALMADVCLWEGDYDGCIEYADLLINATASRRPAFMTNRDAWFLIFNPGNSNESVFEINFNYNSNIAALYENSPSMYFINSTNAQYQYTAAMCERLYAESQQATLTGDPSVRAEWGAYIDMTGAIDPKQYCIWKYQGTGEDHSASKRSNSDANWIVYRMADVILMKAEALIWKSQQDYQEALTLINMIRNRSGLPDLVLSAATADEITMLQAVLHERDMEFAGEGKRWYDVLRFGRSQNFRYKNEFIEMMLNDNEDANPSWLRSALSNENSWFLPINETEMEANPLLVQNPYYSGTNN